ncbi:peptidoglycan binding domain-containing protein [Streptomyces sp. NPDC089919]|uniref:peptidoglycan binding domain-containing protein n=1 Tax=Streptomyces sp. NPDC089919 TaxID=3155188 RepID=UPI0034315D47
MTSKPAPSPLPEEPKTETTLTTRIRINIPGSRPIPPVVVRKSVASDADGPSADPEPAAPSEASPSQESAAPEPAAEPKPDGGGWFAPRKSSAPPAAPRPALPGPGGGPAAGAPAGGSDNGGTDMNASAPGQRPAAPRTGLPQRPVGRGPAARPGAPGGFGAGGPGAGTAAGPAGGAGTGTGFGGPGGPAPGLPTRGPGPRPGQGFGGPAGQAPGAPAPMENAFGAPPAPAPTGQGFGAPGGPAPTDNAFGAPAGPPPAQNAFGAPTGPAQTGPAPAGFGPGAPGVPGAPGSRGAAGALNGIPAPTGPTTGPAMGAMPVAPRAEDDTTALTPQWPGPELGGDAPTSALPVVPPPAPRPGPAPMGGPGGPGAAPMGGPAGGPAGAPAGPGDSPGLSSPAQAPRRPLPKAKKAAAARKGGSKLVLACSGAVALLGVAYGAGLLLNHSDVPKGTTVLGTDIGGSKEEALDKMRQAFGARATAPIQLTVGGKQVELKPDKAGLTLDDQTTVRNAEGSDYNPLSVIGSLFGNERAADPVVHVDEEKLQVALQDLAGASGSAVEGTITFAPNKVTPVPGKAGTALDVDKSMAAVEEAYRTQLATGKAPAVELPVTTREPVIGQAELDRAMEEFAKPAMSAQVVIKAGAKSIPFGPARSLPKILGMKAVDGKLVETYDLAALKELYGDTFDGVTIMRGSGQRTAVTPEDVVVALRQALRGKTTAERVGVIETDPS